MDKRIIKSALFGYSKTSVCEYIASINEKFSNQLLELEKEHEKERIELQDKLDSAEKELSEYKKAQGDIASALMAAQQYASSIKQKADEENERMVLENQRLYKEQSERLALYVSSIDRLRGELSDFTAETDRRLAEYYERAEDIEKEFEEAQA